VHHLLAGSHSHHHDHHHEPPEFADPNEETKVEEHAEDKPRDTPAIANNDNRSQNCDDHVDHEGNNNQGNEETSGSYDEGEIPVPLCCSPDPAGQLDRVQDMTRQIEEEERRGIHDHRHGHQHLGSTKRQQRKERETEDPTHTLEEDNEAARISKEDAKKLHMMSLNTAIAIAL
jgi:hypothetical protein